MENRTGIQHPTHNVPSAISCRTKSPERQQRRRRRVCLSVLESYFWLHRIAMMIIMVCVHTTMLSLSISAFLPRWLGQRLTSDLLVVLTTTCCCWVVVGCLLGSRSHVLLDKSRSTMAGLGRKEEDKGCVRCVKVQQQPRWKQK